MNDEAYLDSLNEISSDSLLKFLRCEIRSVLPLYATVQRPTRRINQCIIHRFDRPLHQYSADLQNPFPRKGETTLQFLNRLQNAGRRSDWPNDLQLRLALKRALRASDCSLPTTRTNLDGRQIGELFIHHSIFFFLTTTDAVHIVISLVMKRGTVG